MLSLKRSTRPFAFALIIVSSLSIAPQPIGVFRSVFAAEENAGTSKNVDGIYQEIQSLVKEYYPKAKITTSENKLHFEDKARMQASYYSGRLELAPLDGGILGDLSLVSGQYAGEDKDRLPSQVANGFHTILVMAPYSKKENAHLLSRLLFPRDVPVEFKSRFESTIKEFAQDEAKSTETPTTSSVATSSTTARSEHPEIKPAPTQTGEISTTASDSAKPSPAAPAAVTFGSAKLSKYSYPEGRFSVLLPGSPKLNYKTEAGIRMVDYEYPDVHGSYNISYVIMPGQANPAAINLLFDKLTESFVKTLKGSSIKQSSTSLQGFPGRQVDMGEVKVKPGFVGRLRMYSVRRYVYVIGAIGQKDWISAPVVNDFLTSFSFSPELTTQEKMQQDQIEAAKRRQQFDEDSKRRQQAFNERFQRSQSDARKASERAKMDFQTHRSHY